MNIFFLMLIDIMTKKISAKIKYPVYNYMCQYVGLQKFKEKKLKKKRVFQVQNYLMLIFKR